MFRIANPTQIFTVFGSYVLDGDYHRNGNSRSCNQIRCDVRKAEFADILRQAVRQ
jgi:hypothetical protein